MQCIVKYNLCIIFVLFCFPAPLFKDKQSALLAYIMRSQSKIWMSKDGERKGEKHRNRKALSWHLKWHIIQLGWSGGHGKQYTLDWNNIKLFHPRLSVTQKQGQHHGHVTGAVAGSPCLRFNSIFEFVFWICALESNGKMAYEPGAWSLSPYSVSPLTACPGLLLRHCSLLPGVLCPTQTTHMSTLPWE